MNPPPHPLPTKTRLLAWDPLWTRAPARDALGRPYGDFMVRIPDLRTGQAGLFRHRLAVLTQVLTKHLDVVVFAELNTRLGLLWVTVKPVPGSIRRVYTDLRSALPMARIIGPWGVGEPEKQSRNAAGKVRRFYRDRLRRAVRHQEN